MTSPQHLQTAPTRSQLAAMTRHQDEIRASNNATTTFRPRYEGTDPPQCRRCGGAGWVFQGFGEDHECEVCEGRGYDASDYQPPSRAQVGRGNTDGDTQ